MNEQQSIQKTQRKFIPPKPRNLHAFDRLIGLEHAKQEVQDFFDIAIAGIEDPQSIRLYQIKPSKGMLLYGDPGTGKTAFARNCAEYYGLKFARFKGSELIAGCSNVGEPEAKMQRLFKKARNLAPCIVFFDEIDAIAQNRTGISANSPSDLILNNLLAEIDGFEPSAGIFIIGATNRKDILDPALLRPGRLEKLIKIPLPDLHNRIKIFQAYLSGRPIEELNFFELGHLTEGRSGAFIEASINRAAIVAWRKGQSISQAELHKAIEDLTCAEEPEKVGDKES
jgi:transitional endoplasmic reticulum ATPase